MWNLMIVEDESIVRIGLRYMLNWEELGFVWKAEASNGEEALQLLETEDIHIVMTDIRMPGMDGIELTKSIRSKYPAVQVIFISSYDNFSYAREAIRLGALDYLHKATMDEDEVAEVLRKAANKLQATPVQEKLVASEDRHEYLLSLLDRHTFPVEPYISDLEDQKFDEGYWLTVFRRRGDAIMESEEAFQLRITAIQYFIAEYVAKDWGGIVFHRSYREIIWLTPVAAKVGIRSRKENNQYVEVLKQKVFELLNVSVIYSTSSHYQHIRQIPDAYMEVLLQLPVNEQSDNFIVRRAKAYVDQHIVEDITLTKVAINAFVSPGHLSRIFLKEVGENFTDYVIRNKMEYAQKLLRGTNKKIYEIAAEIGYTNSHYFSKLFKERVGLTPVEYRNQ